MSVSVKCFCINDKNKPKEIPASKWVKNKNPYHITHIFYHHEQKIQGVELAEIFLDGSCKPYESFMLTRFAIPIDELEKFIKMLEDCTQLNDEDLGKLVDDLLKEETLVLEGVDEKDSSEDWKKLIK